MADTSGILSEALIASMAAGLLDDYHVTSLDDNTAIGRFLAREFGVVRNEILEAYPWHIAKTRAYLAALTDKPAFGWLYQYQLPDGFTRIIPPDCNGRFDATPIPHEVESGMLLCNIGPNLPLIWCRRETNLSKWSALMGRAFASKLAMYASQRVTGKAAYFDKAQKAYSLAMNEAKDVDSLTRGTQEHTYITGYEGVDSASVRNWGYAGIDNGISYTPPVAY